MSINVRCKEGRVLIEAGDMTADYDRKTYGTLLEELKRNSVVERGEDKSFRLSMELQEKKVSVMMCSTQTQEKYEERIPLSELEALAKTT